MTACARAPPDGPDSVHDAPNAVHHARDSGRLGVQQAPKKQENYELCVCLELVLQGATQPGTDTLHHARDCAQASRRGAARHGACVRVSNTSTNLTQILTTQVNKPSTKSPGIAPQEHAHIKQ